MNFIQTMTDENRKRLLGYMWIFILVNMIYADIIGMLRPGYVDDLNRMSIELSEPTVLFFAVMMELMILPVIFASFLPRNKNRWFHFLIIPIGIAWIVGPAVTSVGGLETPLSYIFFASVEVFTLLFVLYTVCVWPKKIETK